MTTDPTLPARIVLHAEPNFISPYVFACYVTLKEKRQPFELVTLDSAAGQTRDVGYLARTYTGRVPSLMHGDFALAESSAIVEYLDECFPEPPLLPTGREERARCRQLMSWARSDETAAIREERPSTTIFYAPPGIALSEAALRSARKLDDVVVRLLGDRQQLFEHFSIADAELAFLLMRLIAAGDTLSARARTYAEQQWQRPSVQAYVSLPRPPL